MNKRDMKKLIELHKHKARVRHKRNDQAQADRNHARDTLKKIRLKVCYAKKKSNQEVDPLGRGAA